VIARYQKGYSKYFAKQKLFQIYFLGFLFPNLEDLHFLVPSVNLPDLVTYQAALHYQDPSTVSPGDWDWPCSGAYCYSWDHDVWE